MAHWQTCEEYTRLLTGFGDTKAWCTFVVAIEACSHLIRQGGNFSYQFFDFV